MTHCVTPRQLVPLACILLLTSVGIGQQTPPTQPPSASPVSQPPPPPEESAEEKESRQQATNLLRQVLATLVHGRAFDSKVRETVWTTGREVVGVGSYEQSGGGSGQFLLQLTMFDGDGKHRLQQISDGRLAWTRSEIAGRVTLLRVDVGRLGQWAKVDARYSGVSPRLRVGAWAEMLSTIQRDYTLSVQGADLAGEPMWVITGRLRNDRREEIMAESGRQEWPSMYPTVVRIAVRSRDDPNTGFGRLLPVRIEYWSDPVARVPGDETDETNENASSKSPGGRLITLIELYSIRPIRSPMPERFRFDNQDAEVNFINDTERYIKLYGVRITDRQRRELTR